MSRAPVTIAVVGAGSRGTAYAHEASEAAVAAKVVAIAEPRAAYRRRLAEEMAVDPANQFDDWRKLAEQPRLADAVVIATQDRDHVEPALAFAGLGYHILLEKPMATTQAECEAIVAAAKRGRVLLTVCHVLRYTPYTSALQELLASGKYGEIASISRLEPVGWWHQAHSFVRGNWRNEAESSPMLLAKSCHDIDWIRHVIGRRCTRVSSFGSLMHFRAEHRPAGAGDRCVACGVEDSCAYSALRFYTDRLNSGDEGWPLDVLTPYPSRESVRAALETGPYGRCVYASDNDVVDHQVVNMEFDGGATAALTMTAFTQPRPRQDSIFCTGAEITGDGHHIEVFDFLTGQTTTIDTNTVGGEDADEGHGGGDSGLVEMFLRAVANDDPSLVSDPHEDLQSYRIVFAAERSRRSGETIRLGA
jgi:predicted dehydrogenase